MWVEGRVSAGAVLAEVRGKTELAESSQAKGLRRLVERVKEDNAEVLLALAAVPR